MTDDLTEALITMGRWLADVRHDEAKIKAQAKALAIEAIDAGIPERHVAKFLGINRMSLRGWLGKQSA